jgi:hypothetical protein
MRPCTRDISRLKSSLERSNTPYGTNIGRETRKRRRKEKKKYERNEERERTKVKRDRKN